MTNGEMGDFGSNEHDQGMAGTCGDKLEVSGLTDWCASRTFDQHQLVKMYLARLTHLLLQ
jgi:hypothetical protein